jgi:TPP-dependent pyruvate/acetoin dehydrogenase alpha subunit
VFAVYDAARRAAEHARAGNGPYLIECKTFRMTGHSAHDQAEYVPPALKEEWAGKDPITRLEAKLAGEGWASRKEIGRIHDQIREEVDAAIEWAEKSPYPEASELLENVYDRS